MQSMNNNNIGFFNKVYYVKDIKKIKIVELFKTHKYELDYKTNLLVINTLKLDEKEKNKLNNLIEKGLIIWIV